jgi:hypothetical protein
MMMNETLKKLNYKKGRIDLSSVPPEFLPVAEDWRSEGLEVRIIRNEGDAPANDSHFQVVFVRDAADVASCVPPSISSLTTDAVFWVAFPKQSSKRYSSDINRDSLWKLMTSYAFHPCRNVALDDDWSALRFAPDAPAQKDQ